MTTKTLISIAVTAAFLSGCSSFSGLTGSSSSAEKSIPTSISCKGKGVITATASGTVPVGGASGTLTINADCGDGFFYHRGETAPAVVPPVTTPPTVTPTPPTPTVPTEPKASGATGPVSWSPEDLPAPTVAQVTLEDWNKNKDLYTPFCGSGYSKSGECVRVVPTPKPGEHNYIVPAPFGGNTVRFSS